MHHSISFIGLLGLYLSEKANDGNCGQVSGKKVVCKLLMLL